VTWLTAQIGPTHMVGSDPNDPVTSMKMGVEDAFQTRDKVVGSERKSSERGAAENKKQKTKTKTKQNKS
jgi:hypothetical protein